MTVHDRFKLIVEQSGQTQASIAAALSVTDSFVNQMLKGKRIISVDTITKLCEFLHIPLYEFFTYDKEIDNLHTRELLAACENLSDAQVRSLIEVARNMTTRLYYTQPIIRKQVTGLAAAGAPLYDSLINEDFFVEIPPKYANGDFYIVQSSGDSMEPYIHDGDFVIAQKNVAPDTGGVALVRIASIDTGEYTIKRVNFTHDEIILESINSEYSTFVYPLEEVLSADKVVCVLPATAQDVTKR